MSFVAYLYVEQDGNAQYEGFTGEHDKTADGKEVEKMSRVQEVDHQISVPRDVQTGRITGAFAAKEGPRPMSWRLCCHGSSPRAGSGTSPEKYSTGSGSLDIRTVGV